MSLIWYILFFTVLILIFVSIIIGAISQKKIIKIFSKYSKIKTKCEIKSSELSTILISKAELDINIAKIDSRSSNVYNSKYKILKLTSKVYESIAISSLAFCSHEIGDAIQDKNNSLSYRTKKYFYPIVKVLTSLFIPFSLLGFFFKFSLDLPIVALIILISAIVIFIACIIFYLVTYRIENKSADLIAKILNECDFFTEDELFGLKDVLYELKWLYLSQLSYSLLFFLDFISYANMKDKIS